MASIAEPLKDVAYPTVNRIATPGQFFLATSRVLGGIFGGEVLEAVANPSRMIRALI